MVLLVFHSFILFLVREIYLKLTILFFFDI